MKLKFRKYFALVMALVMLFSIQVNAFATEPATELTGVPVETSEEAASAEETPSEEETPTEDIPVEETPVEDTPVEDEPVEDTPVEDTPVEDEPVEDTPAEDAPEEDTPVEDTPEEDTPVEDTPVEDTPVEDTPEEDTPVEDTPVEDTPVEDTPVEDTPVEDAPVEDTPVEDTPVEDAPVEDTPVEDTPVEDAPVEDTPVEDTPVEDTPVEDAPVEDAPVEDIPSEEEEIPAEGEEIPAEGEELPPEELVVEDMLAETEAVKWPVSIYIYTHVLNNWGSTTETALSYRAYTITDNATQEIVVSGRTSSTGYVKVELPNGSYTLYTNTTGQDGKGYEGERSFTVADGAVSEQLFVQGLYSETSAQAVYNRTNSFGHVDVRVRGTYTTGTPSELTKYNITIGNVVIKVNGNTIGTFTRDTAYEWRVDRTSVSKSAKVTVNCDILMDGEKVADYSQTFQGEGDFVQAIRQCDANQGLDFIINATKILEEVIEKIYKKVSYAWTVEDEDADLVEYMTEQLEKTATPPAGETGLEVPASHTVDTNWPEGTHFIFPYNGNYYRLHFHGWETWEDEDTAATALGSAAALEITSNTIIRGKWTVESLPKSGGTMLLTKKITGVSKDEIGSYSGRWFNIQTPEKNENGAVIYEDIEFSQMTETVGEDGTISLSYTLPLAADGTYVIKEMGADVTGYTRTTSADASASYTAGDVEGLEGGEFTGASYANDAISVTITLPTISSTARSGGSVKMGSVDFVNSYEKKFSTTPEIYEYPDLAVNKLDGDTGESLDGAEFSLNVVSGGGISQSGTTNESGYVYFNDIKPGEYTLVETKAPEKYVKGYALYKATVSIPDEHEEVLKEDGLWYKLYKCTMTMLVSLDGGSSWHTSVNFNDQGDRYRLQAFNEEAHGQLTITKDIAGDLSESTFTGTIEVTVSGPNGYEEVVTLGAANSWSVTLTGLEMGTYTISEDVAQAAQAGYTLNTTGTGNVSFEVRELATDYDVDDPIVAKTAAITNTYTKDYMDDNVLLPDLEIKKYRTNTTTLLDDAEFTLTDSNGDKVVKTTVDGVAKFTQIEPGEYTLVETKAPDTTYAVDATSYGVEITKVGETETLVGNRFQKTITYDAVVTPATSFDGDTNTLTVYNTKVVGDLTITKAFGVDNAYEPDSVEVTVTGENGYSEKVVLKKSEDWTKTLSNLPFGAYTVTEDKAANSVDGYALYVASNPADGKVNLSADNWAATVVVTNTYADLEHVPAGARIQKKDGDTGKNLEGVTFGLYNAKGEKVQEDVTNAEGIAQFDGFIEEAEYTIKEEATLPEYVKSDAVYPLTITSETVQVKDENGKLVDRIYHFAYFGEADGTLVVKNYKKLGNLTVSKQVQITVDGEDAANAPDGRNEEYAFRVTIGTQQHNITLKAGESKTFENIPYGTSYSVEEVVADGAAYTAVMPDNAQGAIKAAATTVKVENNYKYITNNPGFMAVKLDAETNLPIEGAGFTLYSDAACTKAVGEGASDENGKVIIPIADPGTYYLKETTVPTGYHGSSTVYTVTAKLVYEVANTTDGPVINENMIIEAVDLTGVSEDGIAITHVIKNTAIKNAKVSVQKVWNDGEYLAGRPEKISVTLYRDGKEFQNVDLTAANDWSYSWKNLTDEHSWKVDEAVVPADYTKTVAVKDGVYTITNSREMVKISGSKTWNMAGNKNVETPKSVTIRLYADGKEVAVTTATEESKWAFSFGLLPKTSAGKEVAYTITEDAVANFTAAITGDVATGFTVVNTYAPTETYGSLSIGKTVAGTGADTKKAFTFTLTLTDAAGKPASGTISYSGAKAGTFDASKPFSFTLAHEQRINIEGMVAGWKYSVVETADADYTATSTNSTGTILEDMLIKIDFLNTINTDDSDDNDTVDIPKTGDSGNAAAMPVMIALAIMWMGVAFYAVKRRKQAE